MDDMITVKDGTKILFKDWALVSLSFSIMAGRSQRTTGMLR